MVFTILVAADLFGQKLNFELEFPAPPTLAEFQAKAEGLMNAEAALRRPADIPAEPFVAQRMQCFDDRVDLWVDLVASGQLRDFTQVYIFQRETPWHKEVQSKIPPPQKPTAYHHHSQPRSRSPIRAPSPMRVAHELSHTPISPSRMRSSSPPLAPGMAAAGHSEKVRSVFNELDRTRTQAVEYEAFRTTLLRLGIDFTNDVMSDLFMKADANRDGVISFSEFQRFAELYPTLLDCLFYRSRDHWTDERQKAGIEAAKRALEATRQQHAQCVEASAAAAASSAKMERHLDMAKQAVLDAEGKERDARAVLEAAQQETSRARSDVAHQAQEVAQAKEQERLREMAYEEARLEMERAASILRAREEETQRAEQRLRDIQALLEQQQIEVQKLRDIEFDAKADLSSAQGKEAQTASECESARAVTKLAADRLAVLEGEMVQAQERQRDCGVAHLQARDEVSRQMAKRDMAERDLRMAKEEEMAKLAAESDALRAVETQSKVCATLEAENAEHVAKRNKAENDERPLLEQEVRLRSQRETLELEEAKLRDSHKSFHSSTGRSGVPSASPARGVLPTPVPSTYQASPIRGYHPSPSMTLRSSSPLRSPESPRKY